MGKQLPNRLKEVVYTLSPFETTVMSGLWKDIPSKLQRKVSEVQVAWHPILLIYKMLNSFLTLSLAKILCRTTG